ncbi:MAG: hypothetical protein OXM61_00570 [Candidatus Poribacteria bacterium]|nr:hypothetical protein [Candidatus Poribacteria bacterium]
MVRLTKEEKKILARNSNINANIFKDFKRLKTECEKLLGPAENVIEQRKCRILKPLEKIERSGRMFYVGQ